jgi:hypothetical protein
VTSIAPTQSIVQAALAAFLAEVLPGVPGQAPAVFVGSIVGTTLTAAALPGKQPAGIQGVIQPNSPLLGFGVVPGTMILSQISGSTGGVGTYKISISQTLSQPVTMSTGVTILSGQQNRTAEPNNPYFAVFTPISFDRLATNLDSSADCKLVGSIAGNVLTADLVDTGSISSGATLFGIGVAYGTTVIQQLTGEPGEAGTYQVSPSQTVSQQTISAGGKIMTQEAEVTVQIDFHSPDTLAGDFAQTVSTALRDEYGVDFFANLPAPLNVVSPFYADNPAQRPFVDAEDQYEWRWSLDAKFQVDQAVSIPLEYADAATVIVKDVSALYPP